MNYDALCRTLMLVFSKVFPDGRMLAIKGPHVPKPLRTGGNIPANVHFRGSTGPFRVVWSKRDFLGGMNAVVQFLTGIHSFVLQDLFWEGS